MTSPAPSFRLRRPLALMIPSEMEWLRSKGLPAASTKLPICNASLSPHSAGWSLVADISNAATSLAVSDQARRGTSVRPSCRCTLRSAVSPLAITWALVTTIRRPLAGWRVITPEPVSSTVPFLTPGRRQRILTTLGISRDETLDSCRPAASRTARSFPDAVRRSRRAASKG